MSGPWYGVCGRCGVARVEPDRCRQCEAIEERRQQDYERGVDVLNQKYPLDGGKVQPADLLVIIGQQDARLAAIEGEKAELIAMFELEGYQVTCGDGGTIHHPDGLRQYLVAPPSAGDTHCDDTETRTCHT